MNEHFFLSQRWNPRTPRQSGPGSNNNQGVLHILQSSNTGASPNAVSCHAQDTCERRNAVNVFYSPS